MSVGVPVFNEERRLAKAIASLLAQTHKNLEIVVSDNASTDGSAAVAAQFADADSRVRLIVQDGNIGAVANFRSVLEESKGEFFMWAAADDRWAETFIERNLGRLMEDPGLVASTSHVGWLIDGEPAGMAAGTFALDGTPRRNVAAYLRRARDNSRFYGVFRRSALLASYPPESFFALDLATMLGTLRRGRHAEVSEVLMWRERNDPASYIQHVDADNATGFDRWFPMAPFTRYVLRRLRIPLSPGAITFLVARNLYEHIRYAATRRSLYGRLARGLLRLAQPARRRAVGAGSDS